VTSSRKRRLLTSAAVAVAALAIAIAGLALGSRLAGPVERPTALGGVRVEATPAWHGHVDAFIPLANWGVRADAFSAPVRLAVEPRALDRPALLKAVAGDPEMIARTEADLRDAARAALLRALLWGLGFTALLAGVITAALAIGARHHPRVLIGLPLAAIALCAVLGGAALWQVQRTFHAQAFDQPTFYARGAEMEQLLAAAERARRAGERYGDRVEKALTSFASILADSSELRIEQGRRALVASDLHANTLVVDPLRKLIGGQPVFFPGDFGHDGNDAEIRLVARRVADISGQVIAVSGNHDSRVLMRRLAARGVTVLTDGGVLRPDGRIEGPPVIRFAGLRVAGLADPLEWKGSRPDDPKRIFSFAERPNGKQEAEAAQRRAVAWFRGLPERPDVVMIHQNGIAQALARALDESGYDRPLTIVTGHDHQQHVDRHGAVTVVDGGTAGAGGLLAVGSEPIGVAQLHFAPRAPRLQAVDLVQAEPFSGEAQARRVVVEAPPDPLHAALRKAGQ
jgi:predicted phosphodiesterase